MTHRIPFWYRACVQCSIVATRSPLFVRFRHLCRGTAHLIDEGRTMSKRTIDSNPRFGREPTCVVCSRCNVVSQPRWSWCHVNVMSNVMFHFWCLSIRSSDLWKFGQSSPYGVSLFIIYMLRILLSNTRLREVSSVAWSNNCRFLTSRRVGQEVRSDSLFVTSTTIYPANRHVQVNAFVS